MGMCSNGPKDTLGTLFQEPLYTVNCHINVNCDNQINQFRLLKNILMKRERQVFQSI